MLIDPPAGRYTAVNQVDGAAYDDWGNGRVDFESPRPRTENPVKEAWTFTCRHPDGQSGTPREVVVDRGGSVNLGAAAPPPTGRASPSRTLWERRAASGPPAVTYLDSRA